MNSRWSFKAREGELLHQLFGEPVLLWARGDLPGAIRAFHRSLSRSPRNRLLKAGLAAAKAELPGRKRKRRPPSPRVQKLLDEGLRLQRSKHFTHAAECFLAAFFARPDLPAPVHRLGRLAKDVGRPSNAADLFLGALRIDPEFSEAHFDLGNYWVAMGEVRKGVERFRRCLRIDPDDRHAAHALLFALNYLHRGDDGVVARESRRWGRRFARGIRPLPPLSRAEFSRRTSSPDRKLVIGYLTADAWGHPVANFLFAPFGHHDMSQVKVMIYDNRSTADQISRKLRRTARARGCHWMNVADLEEHELARRIREDRVDILVELNGHTASNRLGTLAMRPAPVQVSWLGHPNITGLEAIDYRLTDFRCDPPDPKVKRARAEELIRLPECFLAYEPANGAPPVARAPAIKNGFVTFGSFSNIAKVTPEVLSVWAKILAAVPRSRLTLKYLSLGPKENRAMVLSRLQAHGIEPSRVDLLRPRKTARAHLEAYSRVDISLDTWPYNGTTTTCESLLMGVPCVTLRGPGHAHRVSSSILTTVGLDERWIADSKKEYVEIAVEAASDIESLAAARKTFRRKLFASSLYGGATFMAGLEQVYRDLWARFCFPRRES